MRWGFGATRAIFDVKSAIRTLTDCDANGKVTTTTRGSLSCACAGLWLPTAPIEGLVCPPCFRIFWAGDASPHPLCGSISGMGITSLASYHHDVLAKRISGIPSQILFTFRLP